MLDLPRRDQLIQDHMGLVRSLAVKIRNQYNLSGDLDDMVAHGSSGLVEAANRWDPERGVTFATFAYYRIRGAMLDGLRKQGLFQKRQLLRFAAGADALLQDQAEKEAADGSPGSGGGAARQVAGLARTLGDIATVFVVSLDDTERGRQMADPDQPEIHDQMSLAQSSTLLRQAIKELPVRERKLIRLHYYKDMNLTEAGKQLGLSRSWACRLHARAIRRLSSLMPRQE